MIQQANDVTYCPNIVSAQFLLHLYLLLLIILFLDFLFFSSSLLSSRTCQNTCGFCNCVSNKLEFGYLGLAWLRTVRHHYLLNSLAKLARLRNISYAQRRRKYVPPKRLGCVSFYLLFGLFYGEQDKKTKEILFAVRKCLQKFSYYITKVLFWCAISIESSFIIILLIITTLFTLLLKLHCFFDTNKLEYSIQCVPWLYETSYSDISCWLHLSNLHINSTNMTLN